MPAILEKMDPSDVRKRLGLGREPMGHLMGVSQKTIERWEASGRVPASQHHLMEQLVEIATLGMEVYTAEGFALFLQTPLPDLGGLTPVEMIRRGRADDVIAALAADYEGLGG